MPSKIAGGETISGADAGLRSCVRIAVASTAPSPYTVDAVRYVDDNSSKVEGGFRFQAL